MSRAAGRKRAGELERVREALRKRVSQLTVLYQMGRDISENENWSDALDRFLMALVKYMNGEGTALLLFSRGEEVLAPRAIFQMEPDRVERSCTILRERWNHHPRLSEIHPLESYGESNPGACLEREKPWRISVIPLRHRARPLGFLLLEKRYRSGHDFGIDFHFLNTIQTIFAEQVANAAYISELRSLSRFNKRVLENMNSGVLTTDPEGYVRFYNKRAAMLIPILNSSKRIHFDRILRSERFPEGFFMGLMRSQKDSLVLEVTGDNGEGRSFLARLSTSRMFDETMNGTILVAIFEDLTEQKRLEQEIRRNDRLRTLGQLSAGVAHEIRNPLTGIATSAEILEGKLKEHEDTRKYVRAILEEIARLDRIIKDLLEFARPPRPRLRECSISSVVTRVVNLLSDHARMQGVKIEVVNRFKEDRCLADADQLTQVFLNVVMNSLQACSSSDSISIVISGQRDATESGVVHVEITDTGPGIPPEIRGNLFEPFVTTRSRGTGMGLAISRQIVEEHGGRIYCEHPSKGARFVVVLPQSSGRKSETARQR